MSTNYFRELGYFSSNGSSHIPERKDIQMETSLESESNIEIENRLLNYFLDQTDDFFEEFGEQAPEIVGNFLNTEMVETNPQLFITTYGCLLKKFCFSCDKETSFSCLKQVIWGQSEDEKDAMIKFLKSTRLAKQTYKRFEILGLLDKWEELGIVL